MASKVKDSKSDKIFLVINFIFTLIILVVVLYPLVYVLSASISAPRYVASGEMWLLPKGITFEGYRRIFQDKVLWRGYRNTIFYTLVGTSINLAVTLPAAYALSRKDLVGRNVFTMLMVFTMFFGGGLIPTYLVVQKLNMINTVWALLLTGATSTYNIIVCRTFFQSIPKELEEAAAVEGCSNTRLFFSIILPLSKALIAVMALFFGVGHWNSYFSALIYLTDKKLYPLQLVLREILVVQAASTAMTQEALTDEAAKALANKAELSEIIKYAVMVVSSLPVILIYPFLQKYFVEGDAWFTKGLINVLYKFSVIKKV